MERNLLGERIRQAREHAGLSQEELAERVERDQRAISDYEMGKRKLAAVEIPKFARALNVSILYFFEDHANMDDLDYVMLTELQKLPTFESKQAAIDLVRVLTGAIDPFVK